MQAFHSYVWLMLFEKAKSEHQTYFEAVSLHYSSGCIVFIEWLQ